MPGFGSCEHSIQDNSKIKDVETSAWEILCDTKIKVLYPILRHREK